MRSLAAAEDLSRDLNLRHAVWMVYLSLHTAAVPHDGLYEGTYGDIAAITNLPTRSIDWKLRELVDADLIDVSSDSPETLRISIH